MGLDKIYCIIIVIFTIITPNYLISKEKEPINIQDVKDLLVNLTSLNSNKLENNFKFPLYDKTLLEILEYDVANMSDSITLEKFIKNYNIFFPKKYLKLFQKIVNKDNLTVDDVFKIQITEPDKDEKECLLLVDFKKIDYNKIVLSFGLIYNRQNTFHLEGDYFCDEYQFMYIFEKINNNLVFKEFHIAG